MGTNVNYATRLVKLSQRTEYGIIPSMHRYFSPGTDNRIALWPQIRSEIEHLITTAPDPAIEIYYASDDLFDYGEDLIESSPRIDNAWIEAMQAEYDAWLAAGSEEALEWGLEQPYEPKPIGDRWDDYGTWKQWRADRP